MEDSLKKEIKYSVILLFTLINFLGCGSISQESVLMKNIEDAKMTSAEVGIRINEMGSRYSSTIEEAANKIIAASKNKEYKMNALLWKMYGIPALHRSISIQDPIAAATDTWVLLAQMRQFFETGKGKDLFGDNQKIAVDAIKGMEKDFLKMAYEFRDSSLIIKPEVDNWVKKHPIENIFFNRTSTVTLYAKALGRKELGLSSSIGDMVASINNLQDKLTLNTEFLPKQARWQAEYMVYEFLADSVKEGMFSDIGTIAASIERISRIIEGSPELISSIQQKLSQDINAQRIATIESLKVERAIILKAVSSERLQALEEINRERKETLDRIEKLTDKTIISSGSMLVDVADKIMIRLILLLIITFIFIFIYVRFLKGKLKTD